MVDRVEIFVDTSYLLASFYNSWTTGARSQLEIDLPRVTHHLSEIVSKKLDHPVFRQFWYDGISDSGPHRYQRTLRHIDGVQLRAGQLIEWGDRRTQKGVDTRLVADMVLHSVRGIVQEIVLVTGDADMIPGVQVAVDHGVRVHLIGFGWESMSNSLRSACDTVTVLDPREDFEECMHIEVLDDLRPIENGLHTGISPLPSDEATDQACADDADQPPTAGTPDSSSDQTIEPENLPPVAENTDEDIPREGQNGSVPLIPPVVTPGKCGRKRTPRQRIRTIHVVADEADDSDNSAATITATAPQDAVDAVKETTEQGDPTPAATSAPPADAPVEKIPEETSEKSPATVEKDGQKELEQKKPTPTRRPSPTMMAQRRRPTPRSRYVPLPYDEVWESAGNQTPFDIGQHYATWWYNNAASPQQVDSAHTLTGGGLPLEIDRPLLQFACQTLEVYTLTETQRVNLRDGFHMGIRTILMSGTERH